MIRFLYGHELSEYPVLKSSMFRDRAHQFSERLGWDVSVDENGEERDEYDLLDPLYVIAETASGRHEGSMRFLPTVGPTMVNDHFLHLTDGVRIESPFIWECTRFCVGRDATSRTAAKLLAAGGKMMREFGLDHFVGIFDSNMERVYRFVGSSPTIIARKDTEEGTIGVGLWEFDSAKFGTLLHKAKVSDAEMEAYFVASHRALPEYRESA